jgi:hypothetical protein
LGLLYSIRYHAIISIIYQREKVFKRNNRVEEGRASSLGVKLKGIGEHRNKGAK